LKLDLRRRRHCVRTQNAINLLLHSRTRNWLQLMSLLQRIRSPWLWQFALISYWLALFVSTHLPSEVISGAVSSSDKLIHVIAYAGLALLLAIAWYLAAGRLMLRHVFWAWTALVIYGAFDEWTQTPVGREASVNDWLADALGAAIGLAFFAVPVYYLRKPRSIGD
jgi:VanZ family protein